mgnify:CR=1 FL=1
MFEFLGAVLVVIVGSFGPDIIDGIILGLKIMLIFVCLIFILALLSFAKSEKPKIQISEQEKQIKNLAELYIDKFIHNNTDEELTYENYKEFNNIVQIENGIIVKTDYSSEIVPYLIRNILYTEFIKRTQKLKNQPAGE